MTKAPRRSTMSLADVLGDPDAVPEPRQVEAPPQSTVLAEAAERAGVPMTVFVDPRDRKRVKQVALDRDLSAQNIMHEALSEWLERHGHPGLLPMTANRPSGGGRRR